LEEGKSIMAIVFAMGPPEFVIGFFIFFIILTIIIGAIRWKMNNNNQPQQPYYNTQPSPYYYRTEPSQPSYHGSLEETKTDRSYNGSPVKDIYSGGNYDKERYDSNGKRIV